METGYSAENITLHYYFLFIFSLHHVTYKRSESVTCSPCDGCCGDELETLTTARVCTWQAVAWIIALEYLMWLLQRDEVCYCHATLDLEIRFSSWPSRPRCGFCAGKRALREPLNEVSPRLLDNSTAHLKSPEQTTVQRRFQLENILRFL